MLCQRPLIEHLLRALGLWAPLADDFPIVQGSQLGHQGASACQ